MAEPGPHHDHIQSLFRGTIDWELLKLFRHQRRGHILQCLMLQMEHYHTNFGCHGVHMRTLSIPSAFREVLGRNQKPFQLLAIVGLAIGSALTLAQAGRELWMPVSGWRRAVAFLLVLDIVAGCMANFTRGTNDYYAASSRRRVVFIVVHVHVLLLHGVLELSWLPAVLVWVYAFAGATIVAAMRDRETQLFAGAGLLVAAIVWTVWLSLPGPLVAVHLLFIMKLVLSFAVDHRQVDSNYRSCLGRLPMRRIPVQAKLLAARQDSRRLGAGDRDEFIALMTAAFARDPLFVDLFGEDALQSRAMARRTAFFAFLFDRSRISGHTLRGTFGDDGRLLGCYLVEDSAHREPMLRVAWRFLRFAWRVPVRTALLLNAYMRVSRNAAPQARHHYLTMIGVAPIHQGKGVGSRLLREVVETARSAEGVRGVALDTENVDNVRRYESRGFHKVTTREVARITIYCMSLDF